MGVFKGTSPKCHLSPALPWNRAVYWGIIKEQRCLITPLMRPDFPGLRLPFIYKFPVGPPFIFVNPKIRWWDSKRSSYLRSQGSTFPSRTFPSDNNQQPTKQPSNQPTNQATNQTNNHPNNCSPARLLCRVLCFACKVFGRTTTVQVQQKKYRHIQMGSQTPYKSNPISEKHSLDT